MFIDVDGRHLMLFWFRIGLSVVWVGLRAMDVPDAVGEGVGVFSGPTNKGLKASFEFRYRLDASHGGYTFWDDKFNRQQLEGLIKTV
jgi:hypothetical protein